MHMCIVLFHQLKVQYHKVASHPILRVKYFLILSFFSYSEIRLKLVKLNLLYSKFLF
jgi:hypothetical protein